MQFCFAWSSCWAEPNICGREARTRQKLRLRRPRRRRLYSRKTESSRPPKARLMIQKVRMRRQTLRSRLDLKRQEARAPAPQTVQKRRVRAMPLPKTVRARTTQPPKTARQKTKPLRPIPRKKRKLRHRLPIQKKPLKSWKKKSLRQRSPSPS